MECLSDKLRNLGFQKLVGMSEHYDGKMRPIRSGAPHTYDFNNKVVVIYDHAGRPWIIRGGRAKRVRRQISELIKSHMMTRGAHIPYLIIDDQSAKQRLVRQQPAQLQHV